MKGLHCPSNNYQINMTFPESTFLSTCKLETLYIPKLKPPWNLHCPLSKNSQLTIYMTEDGYQSSMTYYQQAPKSTSYLAAWKIDLQTNISVADWERACLHAQTQTINTRFKLLQYKWLLMAYITQIKLHNFNPEIPDTCSKCTEEIGTLFHCMWEYRKLQVFWKEVLELTSKVLFPLKLKCVY